MSVPTYADNYEYDNVFVYVNKHIEGDGKNVKIKNVIRLNLEKEEIAYIEKAEFDTNDKDIEFLLKHSLGYSPSKLNEVASRCYKEKKYKSALLLFEQSAIRDDMNSQYALANMLFCVKDAKSMENELRIIWHNFGQRRCILKETPEFKIQIMNS